MKNLLLPIFAKISYGSGIGSASNTVTLLRFLRSIHILFEQSDFFATTIKLAYGDSEDSIIPISIIFFISSRIASRRAEQTEFDIASFGPDLLLSNESHAEQVLYD